MSRIGTACVILLVSAAAGQAKLEIQKVQASHGPLGPERKDLVYYPGDEIFFRFMIQGAKMDAEGKVALDLVMHVRDGAGNEVFRRNVPLKTILAMGGGSLPAYARVDLPGGVPPGAYTLRIEAKDSMSSEQGSVERQLTIKRSAFMVVAPGFSFDQENNIPAPAGGILGQNLHFHFRLIGFDRSKERVEVDAAIQVIDANGQEMMVKPLHIPVSVVNPREAKESAYVLIKGFVGLNRVGDFTLRVNAVDNVGGQNTRFEFPIRVSEHQP